MFYMREIMYTCGFIISYLFSNLFLSSTTDGILSLSSWPSGRIASLIIPSTAIVFTCINLTLHK